MNRISDNICNVSLELPTYSPYVAFVKRIRARKMQRKGHQPDPFVQAYFKAMSRWEGVVQHLLASHLQGCPERIISYWSTQRDYRKLYREVDFVEGTAKNPLTLVEIKMRESSSKGKDGWGQLYKSLSIAKVKWPKVKGLCVNIAIGEVLGTEPKCPCDLIPLSQAEIELREAINKETTIWLSGLEIADYAIQHGFYTQEEINNLPRLRSEMYNPLQVLDSD